jgi:GT2 family glycosyltransferase
VSWNTAELTARAVERTLAEGGPDLEVRVLVRDNGSTDGTADLLRQRFPEVTVEVGDNVGFAAGVNALLRMSDAPWLLLLNSDAEPEPGALRTLITLAEQHPEAAAVAPLLLRPDGTVEHSVHALPSLRSAALTALGLQRFAPADLLLAGSWAHDRARPGGWAVGAALLLPRAVVDEVGPWDEALVMYAEDLEWCWRAATRGRPTWFTPDAVVRHLGNASGAQRYGETRDLVAIRNANVVVARHLGRRAVVWRLLNAIGAGRFAVLARLRGNRDLAAHWRRQVPAHLGRTPR